MLLTVPVKKAIIAFKKSIFITGISIDKNKNIAYYCGRSIIKKKLPFLVFMILLCD